jgi:hypothetical protein
MSGADDARQIIADRLKEMDARGRILARLDAMHVAEAVETEH